MAGALSHSPARIIRDLFVQLTLGKDINLTPWPVYCSSEPDTPDDVITVYDTTDRYDGRIQMTGQRQEHHGIQVRVRSANYDTGYEKARALADAMDKTVYYLTVAIGTNRYLVYVISRTTDVLALGKNVPTTKRSLFTINAIVALRKTV